MALLLLVLLVQLMAGAVSAVQLQLRPELYFGAQQLPRDAGRPPPGLKLGLGWIIHSNANAGQLHYDCKEPNEFKRWGFEKCEEDYGQQVFYHHSGMTLSTEHVFIEGRMALRVNGTSSSGELGAVFLVLEGGDDTLLTLEDEDDEGVAGSTAQVRNSVGRRVLHVDWTAQEVEQQHETNMCTELTQRIRVGRPAAELGRTHFTSLSNGLTHTGVAQAIAQQLAQSKRRAVARAQSLLGMDEHVVLNRLTVPLLNNNKAPEGSNQVLVLQRSLRLPFSILVRFGEDEDEADALPSSLFAQHEAAFDAKFASKLPIAAAAASMAKVAQVAVANTLGSVGYFYGQSLMEDGTWTPPAGLLTGVPSRSFFPRGFFWDEGFHQLLVSRFSPAVAKRVVESWLQRFDANGWVAREQILGPDAIEKVPEQFLAQNREYANPPTLLLAIESLMDNLNATSSSSAFFQLAFDKFMPHKRWLEQSQQSPRNSNGSEVLMSWRGRKGIHTLPSGIDDYPRGTGKEAHVDLLAWSAWEDVQLAKLARALNKPEDEAALLEQSSQRKVAAMWKHHWNGELGFFNDVGDAGFAQHVGYVGLVPFCLKLVRAGAEFDAIVRHIRTSLLAPGIGLRSLAKFDKLFGQGENYWRGSAWININYLCVEALKYYAERDGAEELARLAKEIAQAVVGNVAKQYWADGFLFESYDANTGRGRGTRPFTGWTALVALLMNEEA